MEANLEMLLLLLGSVEQFISVCLSCLTSSYSCVDAKGGHSVGLDCVLELVYALCVPLNFT